MVINPVPTATDPRLLQAVGDLVFHTLIQQRPQVFDRSEPMAIDGGFGFAQPPFRSASISLSF